MIPDGAKGTGSMPAHCHVQQKSAAESMWYLAPTWVLTVTDGENMELGMPPPQWISNSASTEMQDGKVNGSST